MPLETSQEKYDPSIWIRSLQGEVNNSKEEVGIQLQIIRAYNHDTNNKENCNFT